MSTAAQAAIAASPDIANLLELARDRSRTGRAILVDAVGDLITAPESAFSERETALMNDILQKLVQEVETSVRQALAERLANSGQAPRDLIVQLANDEIEVARPVLLNSPLLDEPTLIEIVRNRSREHQLAIALRSSIGEPVSDALIAYWKQWLDQSQGMDSYLKAMDDMSAEVGRRSGQFNHAEGWRRHLHLGFSANDDDP